MSDSTTRGSAASDVPDLGKPFCTRCHKWGHRYTECPEPAEAADPTDIAATGFAGILPAVPTERLRALVALLYPDHMTPTAKRQIENVIEEYEADDDDDAMPPLDGTW